MGIFKAPNITTRAEKISSFTVSTAEYGACVMELLGTTRISGNVLYYDDFTAHEHRETHRSGKGGGGKTTTITYTYTAAIILGLCEGPIKGIGKVWVDKNVYVYPHADIGLTLFKGTADQQPWGYVTSKHPEKALPYSGLAYMAGIADLGSNASLPTYNFEVRGQLLNTGDGVDVNPADYILYILRKVGMEKIDIIGLEDYRNYCKEADFLISTPNDATNARTAREIINEIASLTNAYIFWSNDNFKIVSREDRAVRDWRPNRVVMYDLTPDDFLEQSGGACVSYSRKDSSELYNRFSVEFLNRANGYEKETVSYEDTADIAVNGVKQANTVSAHYIYTKERAVMLAEAEARKNKYERNKYTFKLGWAFCRLEPGDLVTLTDPNIGLNKVLCMIDSLTESADGELTFTAISRPPMQTAGTMFDVHENERPYIDFNFNPGSIAEPPVCFQPDASLMYSDNEIWIGVKGQEKYWGGCNVWVSNNSVGYKLLGQITTAAHIGNLTKGIGAADTSLEVDINGELISGTDEDAENGNTLLWCDGENLSYTTATLLENGNYLLEGLVRGQYNSKAKGHPAGTQVIRCNSAIFKTTFLNSEVGKSVLFKFTSFNILMRNEQSLAEVTAYPYTIERRDAAPPDVKSLDCVQLATGTHQFWWQYNYPTPNDVKGFEFRYNQGANITWENAQFLHTGIITEQPFETQALRQGVHTVMIRAVDESGNYSKGVASAVLNLGDPLEENVLYHIDASADNWGKAIHNGIVTQDGHLTSVSNVAAWVGTDEPVWTAPDGAYWTERYGAFWFICQTTALASGQMWLRYDIDGPAQIEYRIVGSGAAWSSPADNTWNTESAAAWLDDTQIFKPYTGKAMVKAGEVIQLRANAPDNSSVASIFRSMEILIDVPDREEHFENIAVPASGLALPIVTPNYYTTAVRVDAVQSIGTKVARAAVIKRNPCVIKLVDMDNEPVEAVVDVTWQGFVKEVLE